MFYFNLGNIHPKHRSKLSSIQLLCIVKSNHVTQYGMDAILKPIVADIKELVCECHYVFIVMNEWIRSSHILFMAYRKGVFVLKLEGRLKSTTGRSQQFLQTIWAASCWVVSRRVAQHRDVVDTALLLVTIPNLR